MTSQLTLFLCDLIYLMWKIHIVTNRCVVDTAKGEEGCIVCNLLRGGCVVDTAKTITFALSVNISIIVKLPFEYS